jgi:Fe(3+) dicitrate transport protein
LRSYYTYGVEPRLLAAHTLFGLQQEFQTGVRAHFETQDRLQMNGASPTARGGAIAEDNERNVNAYSLFAQNKVYLGQFTLTPGFRVEYVENERANNLTLSEGDDDLAEVMPGFGATYNPTEVLTLFGGLHKGFAPPRTEDLIGTDGTTATFTDVEPEESLNAELGLRAEPRPGARVEATVFRNDFDNQIMVGSIAGGSTPLAQGETLYEGLELFVRFDSRALIASDFNAYFQSAWTWLPTADQETPVRRVSDGTVVANSRAGLRLPYAPEHLATNTLGITLSSGLDIRIEAIFTDDQFSDFANTAVAPAGGNGQVGKIKSALIFNAAATYPLKQWGATLFLATKNLTDRDYIVDRTRGIRVGMPLLMQGGIEISF